MATGDVPDLIRRYFPSDSPTELARATKDPATGRERVPAQSCAIYMNGTARFSRFPADPTIMGLTDALGLLHDDDVLLAFARSGGRLRIRGDMEPLLVRELRMQAGLHLLDAHPGWVAATARQLAATASLLQRSGG